MRKAWVKCLLILMLATLVLYAEEEKMFNGLYLNLGNLFRLSHAQSRSISPENFSGEKGKGGMSIDGPAMKAARDLGQGWKVSPYVIIKPKETFVLADIKGPGAIQQIWMTPAGNWRFSILRFYWDGEKEPSVEVPVGDFFACGWGRFAQVSSLPVCVKHDPLLSDQLHSDRCPGGRRLSSCPVPARQSPALQIRFHNN